MYIPIENAWIQMRYSVPGPSAATLPVTDTSNPEASTSDPGPSTSSVAVTGTSSPEGTSFVASPDVETPVSPQSETHPPVDRSIAEKGDSYSEVGQMNQFVQSVGQVVKLKIQPSLSGEKNITCSSTTSYLA